MNSIADIRKNYKLGELNEQQALTNPFDQFEEWFKQALQAEIPEPNAMTLATATLQGVPSTRIVLLKGIDEPSAALERGLCWYTNYDSRKGQELAANPWAALQFHWVELERQVRIEGRVEKTSDAESDAYFYSRPWASRIGAWASQQSQIIQTRDQLVQAEAAYTARFGEQVPRPPYWGGYRLLPERFEFWQGRPSRLHDRLCYVRETQGNWQRVRLSP